MNEQPGDPSASLLLTSEKAVFYKNKFFTKHLCTSDDYASFVERGNGVERRDFVFAWKDLFLKKIFSIVSGIDRNKIRLWCVLLGIGP